MELVNPHNHVYLAIKAAMDAKELGQWVVDHGKASSLKGVATLVMLNVTGLRVEHLPGCPTEIAARTGYEYFKVEPHGTQWNKVKEEFTFAMSLGKLEDADISLYVVTPEG